MSIETQNVLNALLAIANDKLKCVSCGGAGRPQLADGVERTCSHCSGSGKQSVTPAERIQAARTLAKHQYPLELAMELSKSLIESEIKPIRSLGAAILAPYLPGCRAWKAQSATVARR